MGQLHRRIQPVIISILFRVRGGARSSRSKGQRRGWCSWPALLSTGSGVRESAVSSPSGLRGGAPAAKRFSCIVEAPYGLSWNLLRPSSGKRMALLPPPPYIRLYPHPHWPRIWALGGKRNGITLESHHSHGQISHLAKHFVSSLDTKSFAPFSC